MPELPRAVISDFGGVLTSPLVRAFAAAQGGVEIPPEAYGTAMAAATAGGGELPLFALERGEITEAEFLAQLERGLAQILGRPVSLDGFTTRLMAALEPNAELFAYYGALRDRGVRLALLTNNVREWEPLWRSKLPIDDVFETVVDSAFVGMRKPDPGIYELTLERLGLPAEACVFVDDLQINVDAARALGMRGVVYRDTAQAIADVEAQFSQPSRSQQ
jgi:putative hydrolase of the HAD superfamily